jgi:DNA invertase Pin-like site-specific DNA recombinase
MIRERVNAGLAWARARGKLLGRPPTKPAVEAKIRKLRANGMGILKIARTLGIGSRVVQRAIAAD